MDRGKGGEESDWRDVSGRKRKGQWGKGSR